ncbi:MAG: hypothetical protein AB7G75_12635 [Candidatus Binatia bacterium]
MRKWFFLGAFSLAALWLLRVYATPSPAPPSWTVELHSKHGFSPGDVVEEEGKKIGHVIAVEPRTAPDGSGGQNVRIAIAPEAQNRLREQSVLFVTPATASTRPSLKLVVFDEKSPVLPPGSHLIGAESEMEVELKRQMAGLSAALRDMSQQLDRWSHALDNVRKSEEKRELEEGVVGFLTTLRRTRDDLARIVNEEATRWRKLYEKIFPPEAEKTGRTA